MSPTDFYLLGLVTMLVILLVVEFALRRKSQRDHERRLLAIATKVMGTWRAQGYIDPRRDQ